MLSQLFNTNLAFFDILLIFIITALDFLYFFSKRKSKELKILKVLIPILIIGLVIFLTIKNTVQEYFAIISIGLISTFYIYAFQTDYKANYKKKEKFYQRNHHNDSNFEFESSIEGDNDYNFTESPIEKDDSEEFESLIGKIYDKQVGKKE